MASIPLVALQSKAPEPINIADEQAKVQAIQQQQQQGQMQKLQLDQAKRDQQDQQLFQQAYMSSHGDINAAADEAARRGASPRAVLQWKSAAIDAQTKALDLVTKQGAVAVQQADLAKGAHAAVDAAKPEDKPGVYQQQLQGLQQAGVDVSKFPQEYPGDEAFKFIGVHVQGYSKLIDEAAKQAEVDKNKAQAADANANAAAAPWKQVDGQLINVQTGETKGQPKTPPVDQQELADYLKKNPTKGPTDYARWKASLSPQAQISVQGGAVTANDPLVQAVAHGDMKIQDVLTMRTPLPVRRQFLQQVLAVNPAYKSMDYDIEKGVLKDFTSGPDAQKLQAFNTAIKHMATFRDMADALDNGNVKFLNSVGNAFNVQFGSDKVGNFGIAKQAFLGEVGRAFDGSGVTLADRQALEAQVQSASSPKALKGAADTAEKLLRGKRDVLKGQFDQGSQGKPNFDDFSQTQQGGDFWSQFPKHQ